MISSPLMIGSYERTVPDYTAHNDRTITFAADDAADMAADMAAADEEAQTDPNEAPVFPRVS
jgi:hypothetical protein